MDDEEFKETLRLPPDNPSPEALVALISESRFFKAIDANKLREVADRLSWVPLKSGAVLFQEGDPVDSCYVLISGHLEVTRAREAYSDEQRIVLARLDPGAVVGATQILSGGRRSATITAREKCGLVRIPRESFEQVLSKDRTVVDGLHGTIIPRLFDDQLVKVLPEVFGSLDPKTFNDLKSRAAWKHVPRGQFVYYQGEETDSFYILISGRLQKSVKDAAGNLNTVTELAPGETVGEMEVITGENRSATIIASRDSELVRFSKEDFDELASEFPGLWRHMTNELIGELKQAYLKTPRTSLSTNILIAPAVDDVNLDRFTTRLQETLHRDAAGHGSCLLLTSAEVDKRIGVPGISQATDGQRDDLRVRTWLSEQERRHEVVLLQTDPTVTGWTQRCIRSADEVMFVARAQAKPHTGAVARKVQDEELAHQTSRRKALVLLHDYGVEHPVGTAAWLHEFGLLNPKGKTRIPGRHFHVRLRDMDDYRRVGRFVARREIGLVLSGGGARGFAHVGCIRAMREQGIPIDMIAGVSMGSLVGAAYALDPEQFELTIGRIKSQLKGLLTDLTVPVVSISKGRRFDQRLQEWFGDVQIEDLWLPYFCVTSNLTLADIFVHDLGKLWWAVRGSGTLPGITAPVVHNRQLLFDGCLLDNLPMDVMRDRISDANLIAVDVVPPHDLAVEITNGVQSPSGWWLLWNKINPFSRKVELPNIFSILQRAGELGSVYGRQRLIDAKIADLYMRPSVGDIRIADFKQVDTAAQIGYDECGRQLSDWWDQR